MIVAGSLGFALGGPLGALLGSGVAVAWELHKLKPAEARERGDQAIFALALASLAAKVAKADGRVTGSEVDTFDCYLRESLGMSVAERKCAAEAFNRARDNETPASAYSVQLGQLLRGQPDRLNDIVTILFSIALADGIKDEEEEQLIRSIARDIGLSAAEYQTCRANARVIRGKMDASPYEVLGVETQASDAEVRAAHRRLVREYHPDVLRSKGLPEDFMSFAKEKLIAANDAWAHVKRERGI